MQEAAFVASLADTVHMPANARRLQNGKALASCLSRDAKILMNADSKSRGERLPVPCHLRKKCNKSVMFVKSTQG